MTYTDYYFKLCFWYNFLKKIRIGDIAGNLEELNTLQNCNKINALYDFIKYNTNRAFRINRYALWKM